MLDNNEMLAEDEPEVVAGELPEELTEKRIVLREKLLAANLIGQLPDLEVSIFYYGSGDSGGVDECTIPDSFADKDEVIDFLWEVMWTQHEGFDNGDGGRGSVTWIIDTDKIMVDHGDYYTATIDTLTEF